MAEQEQALHTPELLEALENLLTRVDMLGLALAKHGMPEWSRDWLSDDVIDDARAAIAKARGQ